MISFSVMKVTLVIDDHLIRRLKWRAAREGRTVSELVEVALRLFLEPPRQRPARLPPLPTFNGGASLVDIADRDALYRAMEGG